jgi:predicted CoA-binding protein
MPEIAADKEVFDPSIKDAASEFLANKRVAVTGVSRVPKGHGSNVVHRRLRDRGYDVFA